MKTVKNKIRYKLILLKVYMDSAVILFEYYFLTKN